MMNVLFVKFILTFKPARFIVSRSAHLLLQFVCVKTVTIMHIKYDSGYFTDLFTELHWQLLTYNM